MTKLIRVALAGLGAVNRSLLTLLVEKAAQIQEQYGLTFQVTAVADSSGAAYRKSGFVPSALQQWKSTGRSVSQLPEAVIQPEAFLNLLQPDHCELLFEGTPVNLETGEPGLTFAKRALEQGIHVVLANKGPLVHQFRALTALAQHHHAGLAYSATVCGALPVINIGQRDLIAAEISELRGIFNSTTNYILAEMSGGNSFDAAVREAQRRGIAEADPTVDINGWDTANKLVIIANSILNINAQLSDVAVTGIGEITTAQLQHEIEQGRTIKLVAWAQKVDGGYQLGVQPTVLSQSEFLAGCSGWEMGIELHTDIYGTLYHKIWEDSPVPTAAAMLRDAINLYR